MRGLRFDTVGDVVANLPSSVSDLFVPAAFTICIRWLLVQVLMDRVLPAKVIRSAADEGPFVARACLMTLPQSTLCTAL